MALPSRALSLFSPLLSATLSKFAWLGCPLGPTICLSYLAVNPVNSSLVP